MAGGAGRRNAAGHAANAGTNTSGAGGLYPIEAWGVASPILDDDLGLARPGGNVTGLSNDPLATKLRCDLL